MPVFDKSVLSTEPPGPPQDLECTDIDRNSATLAWNKPLTDGGSPVVSYIIEKREGKAASWSQVVDTSFSTHVFTILGLIEGYEYFFQVRAKNAAGVSEPATLSASVVPTKRKGNKDMVAYFSFEPCFKSILK